MTIQNLSTKVARVISRPGQIVTTSRARLFPKDETAARIAGWKYGSLPRKPVTELFPEIRNIDVSIMRAYDRVLNSSMEAEEVVALCAIAKLVKAKKLIEIGTYDGNTTLNLAANTPEDAVITTVDLPLDWQGELALATPDSAVNVSDRTRVGSQYQNTAYAHKISQVLADSATLNWAGLPGPFDFAFIDGCHHYDYVKSDTDNVLRNLRSTAIVAWHDYGYIEDVSKVVDEAAKRIPVAAILGTRIAVGFVGGSQPNSNSPSD